MDIKNLSQLKKKLNVGDKLKLVKASNPQHKYLGKVREIIKIQTNGIKFEGGSWLGLGMFGEKAKDFEFLKDGFIYNDINGFNGVMLKYKYII